MLKISKFDYDTITQDIIDSCVKNITTLAQAKVMKTTDPHQTQDWLFNPEMCFWNDKWKTLRDTFLESVLAASGQTFNKHKAWAYLCFPGKKVYYDQQWHSHRNSVISGVMYLSLPTDNDGIPCATTEFIEEDGTVTTNEPVVGSWFIFDSRMVHRPGLWKHDEMKQIRICLAASVW